MLERASTLKPTDYMEFANLAYQFREAAFASAKTTPMIPAGWRLLHSMQPVSASDLSDMHAFFAFAFYHDDSHDVMLAFPGTGGNLHDLRADLHLAIGEFPQTRACIAAFIQGVHAKLLSLNVARDDAAGAGCEGLVLQRIHAAGHSLGGWMAFEAMLALLLPRYIALENYPALIPIENYEFGEAWGIDAPGRPALGLSPDITQWLRRHCILVANSRVTPVSSLHSHAEYATTLLLDVPPQAGCVDTFAVELVTKHACEHVAAATRAAVSGAVGSYFGPVVNWVGGYSTRMHDNVKNIIQGVFDKSPLFKRFAGTVALLAHNHGLQSFMRAAQTQAMWQVHPDTIAGVGALIAEQKEAIITELQQFFNVEIQQILMSDEKIAEIKNAAVRASEDAQEAVTQALFKTLQDRAHVVRIVGEITVKLAEHDRLLLRIELIRQLMISSSVVSEEHRIDVFKPLSEQAYVFERVISVRDETPTDALMVHALLVLLGSQYRNTLRLVQSGTCVALPDAAAGAGAGAGASPATKNYEDDLLKQATPLAQEERRIIADRLHRESRERYVSECAAAEVRAAATTQLQSYARMWQAKREVRAIKDDRAKQVTALFTQRYFRGRGGRREAAETRRVTTLMRGVEARMLEENRQIDVEIQRQHIARCVEAECRYKTNPTGYYMTVIMPIFEIVAAKRQRYHSAALFMREQTRAEQVSALMQVEVGLHTAIDRVIQQIISVHSDLTENELNDRLSDSISRIMHEAMRDFAGIFPGQKKFLLELDSAFTMASLPARFARR